MIGYFVAHLVDHDVDTEATCYLQREDNNWRARLCVTASEFREWYDGLPRFIQELYDQGFISAGGNRPISGVRNGWQQKQMERGYTGLTGLEGYNVYRT